MSDSSDTRIGIGKKAMSVGLAAILVLSSIVAVMPVQNAYAAVSIATSVDNLGNRFFGPSLVRVLITDTALTDNDDSINVNVEARRGTTSLGSAGVFVDAIGTSGQFELYIAAHTDALPANPTQPADSDGTPDSTIQGEHSIVRIYGGASGSDNLEGIDTSLQSGDVIRITYGGQTKDIRFEPTTASLTTDRTTAGNGNRIILSLNDQDANLDPTGVDRFTASPDNITSPGLDIDGNTVWKETGQNTGIFELVVAVNSNDPDTTPNNNIAGLPSVSFPSSTTFTINDHEVYHSLTDIYPDETTLGSVVKSPFTAIPMPTVSTVSRSVSLRNADGTIDLAAPLTLGNGFQIRVTDADRNIDTTERDTIFTTITAPTSAPDPTNDDTDPPSDNNVAYTVTGAQVTTIVATFNITLTSTLDFNIAPTGPLSATVGTITGTGSGLTLPGPNTATITGTGATRTVTVTIPYSTTTAITNVDLGTVPVTVSGFTNTVILDDVDTDASITSPISINGVRIPVPLKETGDNTGVFLPDLANNKIEMVPVATLPSGTDIATGIRLGSDNKIYVLASAIREDIDLTITYKDPARDPTGIRDFSITREIGHVAGSISTTTPTIPVTGRIIVQITDNDLNVNPLGKDFYTVTFNTANSANENNEVDFRGLADLRLKVNGAGVNFSTNNLAIPIEETDNNTGVFTGDIRVSTINSAVSLADGDRVTIEYIDNTESPTITRSVDVRIGKPSGVVELDRSSYPPSSTLGTTKLYITITDPARNASSRNQDTVDLEDTVVIKLIKGGTTLTFNPGDTGFPTSASETDVNTGVFEVDVNLPQQIGTTPIGDGWQIRVEYEDSNGDTQTATATVTTNTAQVTTDRPTYDLGQTITLRIVERDWNFDSDKIDEISTNISDLVVNSDKVSDDTLAQIGGLSGITLDPSNVLRETGKNTGVFEIQIKNINSNLVSRGKNLEFTYTDETPSGGGTELEVKHVVLITAAQVDIIFDKETYTPFDRMLISIVDPAANQDPDVKDDLGGDARVRVIVGGTSSTQTANFEETEANSGVFRYKPNDEGILIRDINANAKPGDGIRVEYRSPDKQTEISKSVTITFSNGSISLDKESYKPGDTAVITIEDPDENRNPDVPDQFNVKVVSTIDPTGISVTVRETGDRTGVFKADIILTTGLSSGNRLQVREGDQITAVYTDETLPNVQTINMQLVNRDDEGLRTLQTSDVQATATIGVIVPPTERTAVAKPSLRDQAGNVLQQASVDVPVSIASSIKNNTQQAQKFVYIVQVKDADGFVVSISTVGGTLAPGQTFDVSASWTSAEEGTYTIEIFVWNELGKPSPLSKVESATVRAV